MSPSPPLQSLQEQLAEKKRFRALIDLLIDATSVLTLEALPPEVSPEELQKGLFFAFAKCLQQGPGSQPEAATHPRRLLHFADQAAKSGQIPVETPGMLVEQLLTVEKQLLDGQLWSPQHPFWWQLLALQSPLTTHWLDWCSRRDRLGAHFPECVLEKKPLLAVIPNFMDQRFLGDFHEDLSRAYAEDQLGMERGGVGGTDRISRHRTDEVRFLDGTEAEWKNTNQLDLALLTRWLRFSLANVLGRQAACGLLYPPQKAMLARYPAPSAGYAAHIDNPGGEEDNGRAITVLLYLNPKSAESLGGQLTFWKVGSDTNSPPDHVVGPRGGTLVCFDARQWLHQVEAVGTGPARWAISLWLNDRDTGVTPAKTQTLNPTDVLLHFPKHIIPKDRITCHHLESLPIPPGIQSYPKPSGRVRVGFVCTTYRGGALLERWCEHHLALGAARLYLIFDHLSDPSEQKIAHRLLQKHGSSNLYIGDGEALLQDRWAGIPSFTYRDDLMGIALSSGTSWSVAARQSLNASYILWALQQGKLGQCPDWLVHLDTDEQFHLEGQTRGGESLNQHFGLASSQGWKKIRYANHELLPPWQPGESASFKINPRLGQALLGTTGWKSMCRFLEMGQEDVRPYFNGYHNGKSAVAVEAGLACAGVHDWYLREHDSPKAPFLAGPSILHFHCPNAEAFVAKYLAKTARDAPSGLRPFPLSPMEEAARSVVSRADLENLPLTTLREKLHQLYASRTQFSRDELELLEAAKLVWKHEPTKA